jgi:hypothetical protein
MPRISRRRLAAAALVVSLALAQDAAAQVSIPGLHNTGFDVAGNRLPFIFEHYVLKVEHLLVRGAELEKEIALVARRRCMLGRSVAWTPSLSSDEGWRRCCALVTSVTVDRSFHS